MSQEEATPVNPKDLQDLKDRMKLIVEADPKQYHNEFSLKRYLRAFKTTDEAFQVKKEMIFSLSFSYYNFRFLMFPP